MQANQPEKGVSVVKALDEKSLDQNLGGLLAEERTYPSDVVQHESVGVGGRSDVEAKDGLSFSSKTRFLAVLVAGPT